MKQNAVVVRDTSKQVSNRRKTDQNDINYPRKRVIAVIVELCRH